MVFRAVPKTAPRGGVVVEHCQRGHQLDRQKADLTRSDQQFDYIKSRGVRPSSLPWSRMAPGIRRALAYTASDQPWPRGA